MAYFKQNEQYRQQAPQPVYEAEQEAYYDDQPYYDDDYDEPYYDDDYDEPLTREERRQARQARFRVMAGLLDFLGVIAGMVAILVVIALLVSLVTWLQSDIYQTFTLLTTNL